MRIRLTALALLVLGGWERAQAQAPANDDPCAAVTLTAQGTLCTVPVVSTTANATTTAPIGYQNPAAGCGTAPQPTDVWFKFTTAATGPASFGAAVTLTGNPAGTVRLFSAASCQGPFTQLACSGAGQANTVAPRLTTGALQASTTYYVSVAGYAAGDPTGPFTICLTDGPGLPTCAAPTFGAISYGSSTTATIAYTPGVNNTTPVAVLVTGPAGFSQTSTSTASPIQLSGLTQGTTYTVSVTAPCAASNQTAPAATTTITTPTRYCSTGLGTNCSTSNITDVSIASTTLNNTNQSPGCVAGGYSNFAATGRTTATLQPGTPYSLSVKTANMSTTDNVAAWLDFNQNGVYEASENIMPVGTAGFNITRTISFNVPLNAVAGPTGLRVRSLDNIFSGLNANAACANLTGGETEDYTVTIGAPAACPTPTGLAISNLLPTSATLSFNTVPGAVNYTVTYNSFSGGGLTRTLLATGSPVQLTGLAARSISGATIVTNCGPGVVSDPVSISFQMPGGAPDNDECTAATLLATGTNPTPINGNTNEGSVTAPVPTASATCTMPVNQDVWYRFVATQAAHTVVVNIEDRASILIDAFSGSCAGTFTRLGCVAYTGIQGNQSVALTVPLTGLTPGQTYYVRVGQSVSQTYAYTYNIAIRNPGPGYCLTGLGGNPSCAGPNLVSTAIVGTSLNNTNTTCQLNGSDAYSEFSAFGASTAALTAGQTYQLQTTLTGGAADVSLWIDYNQNYLFEASEYTSVAANATTGGTASFTVPAGALAGPTRLRLRARAAGAGNGAGDACTNFGTTGETEDYTVTIVPAPPCPVPTGVSVAPSTTTPLTGLVVAFTPGTPGATSTTVTATPVAGGSALTVTNAISPLIITGLTPNTSYQVCVRSSCGGGATSAPVCATASTALPCAAATNLTLTRVGTSGNTYSFAWTGPSNGLGYAVSYTAPGGTPQTVTSSVSPVTLTLQPGVAYTFSVAVDCGFNNGAPGATATFTTVLASRQAELAASVGLFPNPAHHAATLVVPAALLHQPATVAVHNALGQVVYRTAVPAARVAAQVALDLAHLPAGLYLVQLATSQGPLVKRLLVE